MVKLSGYDDNDLARVSSAIAATVAPWYRSRAAEQSSKAAA